MSMCRVFSCVVGRGCFYDQCVPWQNSISLCPALFRIPRPSLPVTPGVSWLPTFALQSPLMKGHLFWVLVLKGLAGLHRTVPLQLLQCYWWGRDLDYCDTEWLLWITMILNQTFSLLQFFPSSFCPVWGLTSPCPQSGEGQLIKQPSPPRMLEQEEKWTAYSLMTSKYTKKIMGE